MQELYIQDELVDYNDPLTPPPSNSPAQSPLALDSDTEEGDERRQEEEAARIAIEQERKAVEDAATKRRAAHMKEVEILTNRLTENGWKMRMKVWADPGQTFRPTSMTAPTKPLAEILQLIPLEDAEQVSEFQGLVYMPSHFLEKYLLPTMQIRKLLETENQNSRGDKPLPGGPETAIMYALYHQTRQDKTRQDQTRQDKTIQDKKIHDQHSY